MKDLSNKIKGLQVLDALEEGFQLISMDFRYLYVNHAVVKQSKYTSKEDLLGFTMMEKYPGIEKSQFFGVMKKCMDSKSQEMMENEFIFPNGSIGYFELKIMGVPEGAIILSTDITERKLAEKEKESRIRKLEEMMFVTSHKVRQPVTQILGISYLLDKKMVNHADFDRITGYLKNSVNNLDAFTRELTNALHDLKLEAVNRESLNKGSC